MNNLDFDNKIKSNTKKPKCNNKKIWLKILWYVFLFPVAMTVLIVKNKKMNNIIKSVLIVVIWIPYFSIFIASISSSEKKVQSNPSTTDQTYILESESDESKSEDVNKDQSKDGGSTAPKDSMKLSLGDTYDDKGVKVTLQSLEKLDNSNKLKVKIENSSSEAYHLSMLSFGFWTVEDERLMYTTDNTDDVMVGKDIKPNETFECQIFGKSGDVSYITYAVNTFDHKSNPIAKWVITENTKTQKERDEESKNASSSAQESFKSLMPYPSEVKFPLLNYSVERVAGGFYQYGTLKYKNAYGNKVKGTYRMWYNKDGTLTKAELDGKTLK